MLHLITVNYHSTDLIARLLASLPLTNLGWQLLIVNNSPADTALPTLASSRVLLLEVGENLGFGRGCNRGLRWLWQRQPGAIAWLINPDTVLPPGMLAQALAFLATHPPPPIVGTEVRQPDGQLWAGPGQFDSRRGAIASRRPGDRGEPYEPCDWVSGCSLLVNLACFPTCPQFDPAFFLYYEDFDFCQRYRAQGYAIAYTSRLHIIHFPSSITARQPGWQLRHSTFSYLLVLQRYASSWAYTWRLARLLLLGLLLLGRRPAAGWGKLRGAIAHGRWRWRQAYLSGAARIE